MTARLYWFCTPGRPSSNATTIYTRYLDTALGNVPGNVVPDEIRWSATRDDEDWDIWTYQTDIRGVFEYWGVKHEALLGLERIDTRGGRVRFRSGLRGSISRRRSRRVLGRSGSNRGRERGEPERKMEF